MTAEPTDRQAALPDSVVRALRNERDRLASKLEVSVTDKADYLGSYEAESKHEAMLIQWIKDIDGVLA